MIELFTLEYRDIYILDYDFVPNAFEETLLVPLTKLCGISGISFGKKVGNVLDCPIKTKTIY